ncbi:MAG: DNA mismatch repair endonuclease MutL, partial [Planctomycetes bacterium]|nr:DNA mismatch repair endonuclease MutL [Planctomycetota bacterium]
MGIIRLLPPELVDKIAAGEVVERPASVVKELIENALDAGARHIEVTLEEGGRKLIRIADDGHGIPPEELPLAFASHATSKLAALDGLFEIATLGFRGEALASVGSVAQARILSRTRGADAGAAIADEGGHIGPVEPAAAPVGTTVEIRNLFFNVPVRRKFLKDPSTEFGHVQDVVRRYALAYLEVAFHLTHEGRRIFALPPAASLVERIRHFEGDQVADALFTVEAGDTQLGLRAAFGPPALHRGNSGLQYFFLNGRYIKDRLLYKAVADSYREMIPPRRYPVAFLFLTIDPREVDVNVHPTKLEVRFRNSWRIFQLVIGCLRSRLLKEVDSFALRPDQLAPAARPGAAALAPSPSPAAAPFASALAPSPSPTAAGEGWGEGRSAPPTASAPPHLPGHPAARQEVFRRDRDAFFGGAPAPAPTAHGPSPAAAPSASALASSPAPAAAGEGRGEGMSAPPTASASPSALPLAALPVFAGAAPGRRFAQLHDSYIIEEIEDGFLIIDQHAL